MSNNYKYRYIVQIKNIKLNTIIENKAKTMPFTDHKRVPKIKKTLNHI